MKLVSGGSNASIAAKTATPAGFRCKSNISVSADSFNAAYSSRRWDLISS